MKQAILRKIELWSIKTLYDLSHLTISRINRKNKKIIFNWTGAVMFRQFSDSKERLAITLLRRFLGYKIYEEQLCFWIPIKRRPDHTWGEIQDIIRAGHQAKWGPIPKVQLPSSADESLYKLKKVIRIKNDPSFNKGVITYVVSCNPATKGYKLSPKIEYAYDYADSVPLFVENVFEFIKDNHKTATVELINVTSVTVKTNTTKIIVLL